MIGSTLVGAEVDVGPGPGAVDPVGPELPPFDEAYLIGGGGPS